MRETGLKSWSHSLGRSSENINTPKNSQAGKGRRGLSWFTHLFAQQILTEGVRHAHVCRIHQ